MEDRVTYAYPGPGAKEPWTKRRRAEQMWDNPRLYFATEFLLKPSAGWDVDWSTAVCEKVEHGCGHLPVSMRPLDCDVECIRGTLVKCENPPRVWKLTGEYDAASDGYEAVWPD